MKTLSQIEPRIAITNAGAFTISQPGSYYLTTNVAVGSGDAITIITSNVTVDLNGFTVSSTDALNQGSGVNLIGANSDIAILNGHIKGSVTNNGSAFGGAGFQNGIYYSGPVPANVRVAGLSVTGCKSAGIYLFTGNSVVESCLVQSLGGGYGIYAGYVSRCTVSQVGGAAIYANTVSDSTGQSTGGNGVFATVANNCYGYSAGSTGLSAAIANSCYGRNDGGSPGLQVSSSASNCRGSSASGTAIAATDGSTLIGCTVTNSSVGLAAGNGCTIKDCSVLGCTSSGIVAGTNATIQNCSVFQCASNGITANNGSTVSQCTVSRNQGMGMSLGDGCVAGDCTVYYNHLTGISAGRGCVIRNCSVYFGDTDGIVVVGNSHILNNDCSLNGLATATGIRCTSNQNRIEGNHVTSNYNKGIDCGTSTPNSVFKNTASGNAGGNYINLAGNDVGPIGSASAATSPWANISY